MRKLVIRVDDVGYTNIFNMGSFETTTHGYTSHMEVMMDCPGTEDALKRLRDMPWISVGWHIHFWMSPVLAPDKVPSMVIPGTNRFRHDLLYAKDVNYEEVVAECRAELEKCISILGRVPDTGELLRVPDSPAGQAVEQVLKEYHIVINYKSQLDLQEDGTYRYAETDPMWKDRHIFQNDFKKVVAPDLLKETLKDLENYDPVACFLEDRIHLKELPEDAVLVAPFHAGYVDYVVARDGDYGEYMRYYTLSRVYDVEALCSGRLHDWIKENHIELCNLRDALYGTHDYQNYLNHIGSDLYVYG